MQLSRALQTLPAAEYRNLLRQAVGLRADTPTPREVNSITKGKTYSHMRDRLSMPILVALVAGEMNWIEVMRAINEPLVHSRIDGKTPVYGWPAKFGPLEAERVMRAVKKGDYDKDVADRFPAQFSPTLPLKPMLTPSIIEPEITMTTMFPDMTIDEIYEAMITLAATKLSLLKTQADAAGEAFEAELAITRAKEFAGNLIRKHFGEAKANAADKLMELDVKAKDLSSVAGTDSVAAGEAVRKIVAENAEAFRLDTGEKSVPTETLVMVVKPDMKSLLDLALSQATSGAFADTDALIAKVAKVSAGGVKKDAEIDRLKRLLAAKPVIALKAPVVTGGAGTALPSGTVITVKAGDVFRSPDGRVSRHLGFDVPAFDWAGADHPYVPAIDRNYIFKPLPLAKFLWSLNAKKKGWLHGHTGTGKTTFVEQVCARLNWPFFRVNLDSEITRMDLIGRDTLSSDGKGGTISKFVEGILPQAMTLQGHGGVLCVDEVSFGRPDVMYVFQRVLEDKGLLLNEDGGRLVHPGDMFRIVATDNTRGQGDEFGAYQGARPQSAAFLDRFVCWMEFEYLSAKEEAQLLVRTVPTLVPTDAEQIANFATEVRTAFKTGSIYQTISPRGTVGFAEAYLFLLVIMDGDRTKSLLMAGETTILAKANENDRQVIRGIFDRTFK